MNLSDGNASIEKSDSNTSIDASDSDEGEVKPKERDETAEIAVSLSNENRERLCLKAEQDHSTEVILHPVLVVEWMNWIRRGWRRGGC